MYILSLRAEDARKVLIPLNELPKYVNSVSSDTPMEYANLLEVIDMFTGSFESTEEFIDYININYADLREEEKNGTFIIEKMVKPSVYNFYSNALIGEDQKLVTSFGLKQWFLENRDKEAQIRGLVDSLKSREQRKKVIDHNMSLVINRLANIKELGNSLDELDVFENISYEDRRRIAMYIIERINLIKEKEPKLEVLREENQENEKIISKSINKEIS